MTPNRLGQTLGMGLEATDEVPHLHRLLARAVHHRDDATDTPQVTPGIALAQILGDRRGEVGPMLQPPAILLRGGVALGAGHGLFLFVFVETTDGHGPGGMALRRAADGAMIGDVAGRKRRGPGTPSTRDAAANDLGAEHDEHQ